MINFFNITYTSTHVRFKLLTQYIFNQLPKEKEALNSLLFFCVLAHNSTTGCTDFDDSVSVSIENSHVLPFKFDPDLTVLPTYIWYYLTM